MPGAMPGWFIGVSLVLIVRVADGLAPGAANASPR
jgi:hypothetical protein